MLSVFSLKANSRDSHGAAGEVTIEFVEQDDSLTPVDSVHPGEQFRLNAVLALRKSGLEENVTFLWLAGPERSRQRILIDPGLRKFGGGVRDARVSVQPCVDSQGNRTQNDFDQLAISERSVSS